MPLLTSAPISDKERFLQRMQANANIQTTFEQGLEGITHFSTLAKPTMAKHDLVRGKWRDFVDLRREEFGQDDLPAEIEPGVQMVSEGTVKLFILYLAQSLRGLLSEHCTRRSVQNYVYTFFTCWRRYANVHPTRQLTYQSVQYLKSLELVTLAPITRNIRAKPIASEVDLENLIRHAWADRRYLVTSRGKLQFIAVNVLAALTSQRPGALIESTNYRGSNEAIHWRDVNFVILPNPDTPAQPHVAVAVRFRNPKGHRNEPQYFSTAYVVMEPLGSRAYCLVTLLLYLAFNDDIFEDVHLPEDVFHPAVFPTAAHVLSVKQSVANLPVFRADVVENGVYIISPTEALRASTHGERLRSLSRQMGYILHLTMYSWRRGAAGKFAEMLPDFDRQALMNHAPKSTMFQNAYQSRSSTHDLGGIWHGRGQDSNATALARFANSLSVGMDPTAPIQLGVHDRAQLLNEPELVKMREHTAEYKAEVKQLHLRRKSIDAETPEGEEEFAEVQGLLRVATKRLQTHVAQYNAVILRESRVRIQLARDKHMAGSSRRQLGLAPANPPEPRLVTARPPLAAKTGQTLIPPTTRVVPSAGKENAQPPSQLALRLNAHLDVLNPVEELCDMLYHSSYDNVTDESLAVLNGYLGLPERQFAFCYPHESPTKEERCPVCNQSCRRGDGYVGAHIHSCLFEAQENTATDYLEENFSPLLCQWTLCKSKDKLFSSRKAFVKHAETHKNWITSFSARNPDRRCQWPLDGGELCLEDERGMDSWERHFAQVHGINLHEHVQVNYCIICAEWDVDELGDGLVWEDHQMRHFTELFSRFSQRHQGEVDRTPVGVEFMAAVDNAVEYENGSGFDGALPEFHGEVVNRVCLSPMYCPWCVFDESLPIEQRTHQFVRTDVFKSHVKRHMDEVDDQLEESTPLLCPVPSCGTHQFERVEFMTHMVAFHRIPLCGSSRVASVRRLKLPPRDLGNSEAEVAAARPRRKRKHKAATATATAGFCLKCSTSYDDIGKHISGTNCRMRNEYHAFDDNGKRIKAVVLNWELTDSAEFLPTPGRTERKLHRCVHCRRQFTHIREHFDNPGDCVVKSFRIDDPKSGERRSSKTPLLNVKEWLENEEKDKRLTAQEDDRGEGPSKRARVASPEPEHTMFMCNRCNREFKRLSEITHHFRSLRANSKCLDRVFRQRDTTTPGGKWQKAIPWATFDGNDLLSFS